MKQRVMLALTVVAACAVGIGAFVGCGGEEPEVAAPQTEAVQTQTEAEKPAADAAVAEKAEVVVDLSQDFDTFPGPEWQDLPDPSASPYAVPGGMLVYAGNTPPKSFNGYLDNNTFTMMVFGLLYPSMLALDTRTGDYGPSLADRWQISQDKKIFVFHINEKAKWSDGTPVTAHDVKATFDAVTAKESLTGQYQVLFNDIASVSTGATLATWAVRSTSCPRPSSTRPAPPAARKASTRRPPSIASTSTSTSSAARTSSPTTARAAT